MDGQAVYLGEKALEALEELFDSKKIRGRLIEHYCELAEVYSKVISESPIERPDVEVFSGIIFETFSINVARMLFRMKGSILFNLTVAEQECKTYTQIQQMITNCMLEYEKELKEMLEIDPIREFYPVQMKALRESER